MEKRLTTVLAADICNYSALAEADEDFAISIVGIVFGLFETAINLHHGRVFNKAGDGFFAEFPTATDAVLAAQDFLKQLEKRNIQTPDSVQGSTTNIKARVGLHVGDVNEQENGDLLGHGVNVAARLQNEAQPNSIIASQHCIHLVRESSNIAFRKLGILNLKNIQEPMIAYYVERDRTPMSAVKQFFYVYQKKIFTPLTALFIAAAVLVGSFSFFEVFTAREQRNLQLVQAQAEIETLKLNINALIRKIAQTQPDATESQILLVRDVAESLTKSQSPEKKTVRDLIEAERIDDARSLLSILFNKQQQNNANREVIAITAKELGALSYYSHKNAAIEAYEWLWNNSGDTDFLSLLRLADLYLESSKLTKARDNYQNVLDNASNKKLLTQAQIGLGRYFLRKESNSGDGDASRNRIIAEEYFLNAVSISAENGFLIEKVRSVIFLQSISYFRGDYDRAEKYAREALMIEKSMPTKLQSDNRRSVIYYSLGNVLREQKKYDSALENYEQSYVIAQKVNDKRNMVRALYNKSNVYFDLEKFLLAKQTLFEALDIAGGEVMDNMRSNIHFSLGLIAIEEQNSSEACAMLTNWRDYFVKSSNSINEEGEVLYRQHCFD